MRSRKTEFILYEYFPKFKTLSLVPIYQMRFYPFRKSNGFSLEPA